MIEKNYYSRRVTPLLSVHAAEVSGAPNSMFLWKDFRLKIIFLGKPISEDGETLPVFDITQIVDFHINPTNVMFTFLELINLCLRVILLFY